MCVGCQGVAPPPYLWSLKKPINWKPTMRLKYKAWEDELQNDPDNFFLLSGIKNGFDIIDSDADPSQASCNNYPSA